MMYYVGAILVLALITAVGLYSGRRVKSAADFAAGGRKAGVGIVAGTIIGTLVGGSSTIGTAQLAFKFGFSAWWFTLGGGLGCLFLALVFAKPLYNSKITTMPQVFSKEYGQTSSTVAALLTSLGSFLSIVAQILSGIALVAAVSSINSAVATIVIISLMLAYVVFGGVWGAGYVGITKAILLYISVGACGIMALSLGGGLSTFHAALPADKYFNLIARGASVDIGAGISLILGVLTTQAYIQAIISAKNLNISRAGALVSAALIPLVGIGGIFVGMYMKLNYPGINSATALPLFILDKMPPLLAGIMLATLLVTVVGTGAGIALGLSSMLCNDIYKVYFNKDANDQKILLMARVIIVGILVCAALFSTGNMGSMILSWSFMSMGLRGATAFGALCMALFLPGRIDKKYAVCSMIVGPVCVLIGKFTLPATIDPLFLGVGISLLILFFGLFAKRKVNTESTKRSII